MRDVRFLIEREGDVSDVLDIALLDRSAREEVRASFRRRFGSRCDSATLIARRIKELMGFQAQEADQRTPLASETGN